MPPPGPIFPGEQRSAALSTLPRRLELSRRHVVHHQLVLGLILEVLAQLAPLEVPHLEEEGGGKGEGVSTHGKRAWQGRGGKRKRGGPPPR